MKNCWVGIKQELLSHLLTIYRPPGTQQSPSKKPGQKDLKPPDLWIHHDPMEMKSLNKPDRSDSMLTMSTLRRNSQDSKSIDDNLPPYRSDMDKQGKCY